MEQVRSNNTVLYHCEYHVVSCPKCRRPVLTGDMDERLKQIIHGACAERDAPIEAIERMSGKVQVLVICGPQFDIH